MVIPTYWTWPEGSRPGDVVFDHPTPLDAEGTLGRTLDSLSVLDDRDFELAIVAAATDEAIAEQVEAKVSKIIRDAAVDVRTTLFGAGAVAEIRRRLEVEGKVELASLVELGGYGPVRNMCVIAASILGGDAALLIDDDEVFDDPRFIEKVRDGLSRGVIGLAGIYLNGDGSYLLPEPRHLWERRWGKLEAMNDAFRLLIGRPPRLKPTPLALGGNMVIARELAERVPFDPAITRGEDIDYVINAKIAGYEFQLDRELAITHLPPPHSGPPWLGLRQDLVRFFYERDKIRGAELDPSELDPYPGRFLRDDLEERARQTWALLAEEETHTESPVRDRLPLSPGAFERYLDVQRRWRELMRVLNNFKWDPSWFAPLQSGPT